MSSNKIIRSKLVGKTDKRGVEIVIAAATEAQLWTRSDFIADERAPGFIGAVEQDPKPLPKGTVKLIMREGEHVSDNDTRDHYTAFLLRVSRERKRWLVDTLYEVVKHINQEHDETNPLPVAPLNLNTAGYESEDPQGLYENDEGNEQSTLRRRPSI
ncbi:hypothetical protein B7463_g2007, partial [Scytalidium lignicola]